MKQKNIGNNKYLSLVELFCSVTLVTMIYGCISFSNLLSHRLPMNQCSRIENTLQNVILQSNISGTLQVYVQKNRLFFKVIQHNEKPLIMSMGAKTAVINGIKISDTPLEFFWIPGSTSGIHKTTITIDNNKSFCINLPIYEEDDLYEKEIHTLYHGKF